MNEYTGLAVAGGMAGLLALAVIVYAAVIACLASRQRRLAKEAREARRAARERFRRFHNLASEDHPQAPLQEAMLDATLSADEDRPINPKLVTYSKDDGCAVETRKLEDPRFAVYGGDVTVVDDEGAQCPDVDVEKEKKMPYARRQETQCESHAMTPGELEARIQGHKNYVERVSQDAKRAEDELRAQGKEMPKKFDPEKDSDWQDLVAPQSQTFCFPAPFPPKKPD